MVNDRRTIFFESSGRSVIITLGWTLKPWLDGQLFAAILGDCGQRRLGRSRATGGDPRGLLALCQYYSDQWKRPLDRQVKPGNLFNIWTNCRRTPATMVLIGKILYHAVTLPEMTSILRSSVSGDCRRRPIVVKWCVTLPVIADRLR